MLLLSQLNTKDNTTINFGEEGKSFNINQLIYYMQNLKGTYAYLMKNQDILSSYKNQIEIFDKEDYNLSKSFQSRLIESGFSQWHITRYYKNNFENQDLEILYISKGSPLKIVILGTSIILTAAVAFNGGKFKAGPTGVEFEVKSLGNGLSDFNKAMEESDRYKEEKKKLIYDIKAIVPYNKFEINSRISQLENEIRQLEAASLITDMNDDTCRLLHEEINKKKEELAKLKQ